MATLGATIAGWLDAEKWPPSYVSLPDTITIEDGILNGILEALRNSKEAKKEYGATIGLSDEGDSLVLGKIESGTEDAITQFPSKAPHGSSPVGSFHTHPDSSKFAGPSSTDILSIIDAQRDLVQVIAAHGCFYLMVKTKETHGTSDNMDQVLSKFAGEQITQVELEIRNEMAQRGIPRNVPIDPLIPKQIGYDRGMRFVLGKLNIGLYHGTSAVLLRWS